MKNLEDGIKFNQNGLSDFLFYDFGFGSTDHFVPDFRGPVRYLYPIWSEIFNFWSWFELVLNSSNKFGPGPTTFSLEIPEFGSKMIL